MVWVLRPLILLGQLGGGATMIVVKFFRWYRLQLCPDMSSFLRRIVTFLIIAPYEYFSAFGGDILRGFQMHGQERGSYHRMDHFYSGRATLI